jgi:hypothetical protein
MKTSFPWKQTLALFAAVLLAYLAVFNGIEWLRQRKGSWQVEFASTPEGRPFLAVTQAYHKISAVIEFPDEKVKTSSKVIVFDRPKKETPPFGKILYEDLTFLPGVVTFDLFGHEVELLPRVLIADKKEVPWPNAKHIQLWATNKPANPPKPAKGYDEDK